MKNYFLLVSWLFTALMVYAWIDNFNTFHHDHPLIQIVSGKDTIEIRGGGINVSKACGGTQGHFDKSRDIIEFTRKPDTLYWEAPLRIIDTTSAWIFDLATIIHGVPLDSLQPIKPINSNPDYPTKKVI